MKIKDVEAKVGITKANIRYYEKEGLISPERNDENNYREYSEKDVEQLERIKVLRILGVPISDIRELKDGVATLDNVMAQRLEALQEEERNLEAVRRVCENLRQSSLSFDAVTEEVLETEDVSWSEQLAKILKEDITKEILTPAQFSANLALMLSWGYLLCAIVSFILGNWMLSYVGDVIPYEQLGFGLGLVQETFPLVITFKSIFVVPVILSIICYIAVYFSGNIIIQMIIFHICALNLSPLIATVYMYIHGLATLTGDSANRSFSGMHLGLFWLMIVFYVFLLFLIFKIWPVFFSKARYILAAALTYTAVMTLLAGTLSGLWIPSGIAFLIFTLYIGLSWFHSYQDSEGGSRYYAITEGCRIMNLFGVIFNARGLTRLHMRLEDDTD